jgi:transglutaminase-like putative cysteine protease
MRIALTHDSIYEFDRTVSLGPHELRLRPMPGSAEVDHYSLSILPASHRRYWYQDALGNSVARVMFPEPAQRLELRVHLEAHLRPHNPFSFLLEVYAQQFPFDYADGLRNDLLPYLQTDPHGPLTQALVADVRAAPGPRETVDMLVNLNRLLYERVTYRKRAEAGVQRPDQTLSLASGSCRDSAWLFVHVARHLGLAARYISGYQIQLHEAAARSAELHAWAEVYLPGAGWIGFDPTLGLLSAENYIPLAAATTVDGAAPVIGSTEPCESRSRFEIRMERLAG